jgi:hypothetical protein
VRVPEYLLLAVGFDGAGVIARRGGLLQVASSLYHIMWEPALRAMRTSRIGLPPWKKNCGEEQGNKEYSITDDGYGDMMRKYHYQSYREKDRDEKTTWRG